MKLERGNLVGGSLRNLSLPSIESDNPNSLVVSEQSIQRRNPAGQLVSTPFRRNALFPFVSHIFTNADSTGRTGPSRAQCLSAYSETTWAQHTEFFDVSGSGIQEWTVPVTERYRIEAQGAAGGVNGSVAPAVGAVISGEFLLEQGTRLCLLVGQMGLNNTSPGGGGGSFVFLKGATDVSGLLLAAGGAGACGANGYQNNANASLTEDGQDGQGQLIGRGGTNGAAGALSPSEPASVGSGASFTQDGRSQGTNITPSVSVLGGGLGGGSSSSQSVSGGFGGGGAAHSNVYRAAGAGGGYSGGGTGRMRNSNTTMSGGGGGSYNTGDNPSANLASAPGHGRIIITLL